MLWRDPSSHGHYGQDVCYGTPGLLVVLVDQSRHTTTMAEEISIAANIFLQYMVISRSLSEGFHDSLHVVVLGYRSDEYGRSLVHPALIGPLAGRELVSISEIANNPTRIDNVTVFIPDEETGELLELPQQAPVWIDPVAKGESPLCAALAETCRIVDEWIPRFPRSFPPIVWNISSGVFSDGDPWPYADALKRRGTQDGRVLLMHTYVRSGGPQTPFMFPDAATPMPDAAAQALYTMASVVPQPLRSDCEWSLGSSVSESARYLFCNCEAPGRLFVTAFDWDKPPLLR
jgi:hypothetical protein